MTNVAIGMIGCGGIADTLADGVEEVARAKLVGCSDVVEEAARDFAAERGVEWYADHTAMIDDLEPDLAIVATPNGVHRDIVVDCAELGVHLLCQKPLAITVEGLNQMIDACERHDVLLGGLFNTRFNDGAQASKHFVENGSLGDVVVANGICPTYRSGRYYQGWHGTLELDGGTLFTHTIHAIDRLAWLNGGIERVFADLDTVAHDIEVEDVAAVQVRYGNGARGTITSTTATKHYPHYDRIEIHGREGYLVSTAEDVLSFEATGREGLDFENDYDRDGFTVQIADMVGAVRNGRNPIVTGQEARHACDAILAMHASHEQNRPIEVAEFMERERGG